MITLYNADALDAIKKLPDNFVDVVFLDPPYGIATGQDPVKRAGPRGGEYIGVEDSDWDNIPNWLEWFKPFERELNRVAKLGAVFFLCGTYHNFYRAAAYMQDMAYWQINEIIWRKTNPVPNMYGARLTAAHENIAFFIKSKIGPRTGKIKKPVNYPFNYQLMKSYRNGKQLHDVWDIPVCRAPERLLNENGVTLHPTQKPEKLIRMLLDMVKTSDDLVVLDPFAGTGTVAKVACDLGIKSISIERDRKFYEAMLNRVIDDSFGGHFYAKDLTNPTGHYLFSDQFLS